MRIPSGFFLLFFVSAHSQHLQLRVPSHLHKDTQETADAPPLAATSSLDVTAPCGCESCDQATLDKDADGYSCGSRINWLVHNQGQSEYDACVKVSHTEFPTVCGPACDPLSCNSASGLGLCYGYGLMQPTLEDQITSDMSAVNNCYATSQVGKIRTYFPSYYGKRVTAFAQFSGKRLLPGFNPRDALAYKTALDGDLKAIHPDPQVDAIIYLNEKYASDDIQWAEEFLQSRTSSKPIVTSQTTQYDYSVYKTLLSVGFDGIMINVYPARTFDGQSTFGGDPEDDFNSFCSQVELITKYYSSASGGGENFYGVSETGMPADPFGSAITKGYYERIQQFVAGEKNCQQFSYSELVNLNGGPSTWLGIYAFEATSEPNKGSALENSFGVTDAICPSFKQEGHLDEW